MRSQDIVELVIVIAVMCGAAPFLGAYMARVYTGERHPLSFLEPLERLFYRVSGIDAAADMGWKTYALSVASFTAASLVSLDLILMFQNLLPLNPQKLPGMKWDLALNTAISFITNTNWQAYAGEVSLSYFSQAAGLAVHNFLSAACGMAVAVALIRGIVARRKDAEGQAPGLGNFWVDVTRSVIYILLPLSIILAVVLVSQGVIQNLHPYVSAVSFEGKQDLIPMGPAASQIAIKNLGTNGGGFFGQNAAFPFENPTPLSNIVQVISFVLIPAAFPFLFGRLTGRKRQGYVIFAVMFALFAIGLGFALASEYRWGTMEGKEMRFGTGDSVLWAVMTTMTSCGAVNSMHDSFAPLTGMIPLVYLMLGEVVFGGVGAGMYGMLALVFITVFIAGLMVGRGPEYLGKKIEARDVKLSMLAIIAPNFVILAFAAVAVRADRGAWIEAFGPPPGGARIPSEMLHASASGLDPDISLEAALEQVDSVAAARALDAGAKAELVDAIDRAARSATSIIGPPRVDVVELNAKLETDPRFAGTD
ncbi:MAG: potassium-transporting ATPase subunit KdpA [Treponema sp.]|nr:potassium-transporting ATPase subunit KdpA [Treponema sp.]